MVQVQHMKAVHLTSNGTMVCQELQIKNKGLGDVRSKKCLMLMVCAKHIHPQLDTHQNAEDCFHMNTCLLLDKRPLKQCNGDQNRHSVNPCLEIKESQEHDNKTQCNEWEGWLTVAVKDHWCISTERIQLHKDCPLGKTCFKPEDWRMFMQSIWSLCKVKPRTGNGVTGHSGSCPHFLKHSCCVHAACIENQMELQHQHEEIDGSGHTRPKTHMKKCLQKLSRHITRSLSCVKQAFDSVCLLVAERWKELKTSLLGMVNALDHI